MGTEYVVWCQTHSDYLKFVGVSGTSWCDDQADAKRYPTKPAARAAAEKATWLDHRPIAWAIAATEAELPDPEVWCADHGKECPYGCIR